MARNFDIQIGTREFWGSEPIGLTDRDAFQHLWINGQTGTGKSALLLSLFAQIVRNGHGTTLIDLNGDLAKQALDYIPLSRRDDVVIIDPTDTEHVLPINPFYNIPVDQQDAVADQFVQACKAIWDDSWGERMEWFLLNVVKAILQAPEQHRPTLLSIPYLLTMPHYRRDIVSHIENFEHRHFFEKEFERHSETRRSEFIMPIENKIGKIIANKKICNLLSPHKPTYQLKDAITKRSIVIIRLPKGTLGDTAAKLLGSLAVSTILNAAMEQDAVPEEERIEHFLLADEKHNLRTSAWVKAYSELRKYKLALFVASQYVDQLDHEEVKSMFGNIGTIIALRCGPADAKRFSEQLGQFPAHRYPGLGLGEAIARVMEDGSPSAPFRALTTIDHVPPENKSAQIIEYVRKRYTQPRGKVEEEYQRWMRKTFIEPAERKAQRRQEREARKRATKLVMAHQPPTDPGTISERGEKARAGINTIVEKAARQTASLQPRYPVMRKTTRRRKRRSGQQATSN